ncbi:Cellulase (glycosyl hydrolase family 5) [Actinacidiphila yanglinensis]|uniref:Endoglucanase n=1 Tax=Actinacidiphila yanglinensis TaxID=310779 RepID=A0A1H6D2R5_9ACTN|nr:cellulose binding domain-containing protein [Actinacidiphila yanglinensis]SEG79571.1 Cellulase (glycosyl hydrolase family 5) [Actinacidiphila yanglinensis]
MRRPTRTAALSVAAVTAAAAAAVLLPALGTGTAAGATPACSVAYSVTNQWDTGFQGNIVITNNAAPTTSWKLTFDFAGGQHVTQGWGGTFAQSGTTVNVASESYNGAIPTGGSLTAGFLGSWSGGNPSPTSFQLNGSTCNGDATPPPTSPPTSPPGGGTGDPAPPKLHVAGNELVDSTGKQVVLHGVNRSGTEFACAQGNGIFDGPVDDAAVDAITSWKGVNAVRVPLNEDCWEGLSYVPAADGGANYIAAITDWVNRLVAHGITPILDLHWTHGLYTGNSAGCSDVNATCQKPMPDAQYAIPFWTSVANTFKSDTSVVFDLFNEPYPDRAASSADQAWTCWRDGGTCPGIGYQVAGMQDLVDAVRGTGAQNVITLGGLAYSNDETGWLAHEPTDPTGDLAASLHVYNFNSCANQSCWDSQLAPVAAKVPLVAGEIGENTCAHSFVDTFMNWLDAHKLSYLGWTWNTWDCSSGPSLISSYDGTPTAYGQGLKDHLAALG